MQHGAALPRWSASTERMRRPGWPDLIFGRVELQLRALLTLHGSCILSYWLIAIKPMSNVFIYVIKHGKIIDKGALLAGGSKLRPPTGRSFDIE